MPLAVTQAAESKSATVQTSLNAEGTATFILAGWLDACSVRAVWEECRTFLCTHRTHRVIVEAGGVTYCDGAGVAMLLDLQRIAGPTKVEIKNLPDNFRHLLRLFAPEDFEPAPRPRHRPVCFPEQVGCAAMSLWHDLRVLVSFVGELAAALGVALRNPRRIRWRDALLVAENAGVNATPIVALISFLIGLIMAFQSAVPMRQFGAEIYVADLVALSMLRELGPLMTAIILAGRSGSAFAAELGTMKVNEEINALTTMGLDPVRFLVVTRVLAAVVMTPLLTLFANLMGLVGGAVVFLSLDFPLVTYGQQVVGAVHLGDLVGGLMKSLVFGVLVAGIGCLRGLQTATGASAVGLSTTRAVVSGIVLIVLADGLFSVIFYQLGV